MLKAWTARKRIPDADPEEHQDHADPGVGVDVAFAEGRGDAEHQLDRLGDDVEHAEDRVDLVVEAHRLVFGRGRQHAASSFRGYAGGGCRSLRSWGPPQIQLNSSPSRATRAGCS